MDFKIKNSCSSKDTGKKKKSELQAERKVSAKYISHKKYTYTLIFQEMGRDPLRVFEQKWDK